MAKYLLEASYSTEGVEGVKSKGGSSRRDAVAEMVEGLGGKLESFYFGFGESDAYVTVDLPDNETAAALAQRFIEYAREQFDLVVEDLAAFPTLPPIVAEPCTTKMNRGCGGNWNSIDSAVESTSS